MTGGDQNLETHALPGQHGVNEHHILLRENLQPSWALGDSNSYPKNTHSDISFL